MNFAERLAWASEQWLLSIVKAACAQQPGQAVFIAQFSQAAEYRRRAEHARTVAACISLNDTKQQLLELAQHLEVMAGIEEGEAQKVAPIQASEPGA